MSCQTHPSLLQVEDADEPTEIVVHVNKLKEGWDVTNLYTIVPLRASASKILTEQTIGRGLRLPYGQRTGVPVVDRLNIIAHDRFQAIIDRANDPGSIIRTGVVIGRDIAVERRETVVVEPEIVTRAVGSSDRLAVPLFATSAERALARTALAVVTRYEHLPRSADLRDPEIQAEIVREVQAVYRAEGAVQVELPGVLPAPDVAAVIAQTVDLFIERSIDIPRVLVQPVGEVTSGFEPFLRYLL